MYLKRIENAAVKLLEQLKISGLPVPIYEIATALGLKIEYHDMGEENDSVSGLLVIDKTSATIGVNSRHSEVRRRFTIAHELGHYVLHRMRGDLFIDQKYLVRFRDENSAKGDYFDEVEANAFAAAILMPHHDLLNKIEDLHFDLNDDQAIADLAEIFGVSRTAMTYRISNLRLNS